MLICNEKKKLCMTIHVCGEAPHMKYDPFI